LRNATVLTVLGLIAMGLVLTYAFIAGDLADEGSTLLSMPWGIVSLVDLYVGFALFSGWISYRETSWRRALLWIALVMVLGFFAASLYALLALRNSGGSWPCFWMGARTPGAG
jgi:type IV secretory pathway VirB2 component (pilin)